MKITETAFIPPAPKPIRTFSLEMTEAEVRDLKNILGPLHSGLPFGDRQSYDLFAALGEALRDGALPR